MTEMGKLSIRLGNTSLEEKLLWLYTALLALLNIFMLKFVNKNIALADFLFIILFSVWFIKSLRHKIAFRKTHLEFPLFFMIALFLASFLNTRYPLESFIELAGLIYLTILFFVIRNIISSCEKLRFWLYVYFSTAFAISLLGLISLVIAFFSQNTQLNQLLYYGAVEKIAHHFPRLKLMFESPNMSLAYLHVALIFTAILLLLENKRWIKTLILVTAAIIFIAAFFTGSRRFPGLLLSIFIILSMYGKSKILTMIKYFTFLLFLAFLVLAFLTSIWMVFPVKIVKNEVEKTIELKTNYAYSIHYLLPHVAIDMFGKHPIIGSGFGTFNKNFKDNVDWGWFKSSFDFNAYPGYLKSAENKTLVLDPHSLFFSTLAETGLFGLIGLFYFFFRYICLLLKIRRKNNPFSCENIVSGCVLAGLIGFLLNALTMDILSMRPFWIMLAAGLPNFKNKD